MEDARDMLIRYPDHEILLPDIVRAENCHLVGRGFVTGRRPGLPVLRLDPALTIGDEDVDGLLAAFAAALDDG